MMKTRHSITLNSIVVSILAAVFVGCVTTPAKVDKPKNQEEQNQSPDDLEISGTLTTLTVSNSNNSQTTKQVDRRDAADAASRLDSAIKASKGNDRKALVALMALKRLSGEGLVAVMEVARQLVSEELKKDLNRSLPEFAKLEIVLAALQSKKFSFAEFYLGDLKRSKSPRIQAAAFTVEGVIASEDGKLPEAIALWSKAIETVGDYQPALLNLGLNAAKYGDFALAKKTLGQLPNEWVASYGLVTAERLDKNNDKASALCKRVVNEQPRNKPALFNCALHAYQGEKNHDEALSLLDRMVKITGNASYDEKAFALRDKIAAEKPASPAGKTK